MKRSDKAFRNAIGLIQEYNWEGWGQVRKDSREHIVYLGYLKSQFYQLVFQVAEDPKEILDLILSINDRLHEWVHEENSPALLNDSSGNIAYMFEPEEEYYYQNPIIDKLLLYYRDWGLPRLLEGNILSLADELPAYEALCEEWPNFLRAFQDLVMNYETVKTFFQEYNHTHQILENPKGPIFTTTQE